MCESTNTSDGVKVGNKIRIVNAWSGVCGPSAYSNGDVMIVRRVDLNGDVYASSAALSCSTENDEYFLFNEEFEVIE